MLGQTIISILKQQGSIIINFFEQPSSDNFCVPPQLETIGDPHPSLFRSLNPPVKTQQRKDPEESMKVGSWDPKFLQKSGIRKFRHNEGQKYKEGFVMNKHVMNSGSHKFQKYDPFQSQAQVRALLYTLGKCYSGG